MDEASDVYSVATILYRSVAGAMLRYRQALRDAAAAKRLGLDGARTQAVMRDSAAEVAALNQALGS